MKANFFIPLLLLAVITITSCSKKEEEYQPSSTPLSYAGLMLQSDTIFVGETTTVTANASGENLTYSWALEQGSLGDIIGAGKTITYGASPCCTGWNTIACTVSNGATSQSKSVTIVVKEP